MLTLTRAPRDGFVDGFVGSPSLPLFVLFIVRPLILDLSRSLSSLSSSLACTSLYSQAATTDWSSTRPLEFGARARARTGAPAWSSRSSPTRREGNDELSTTWAPARLVQGCVR